jgi:hypothetical protein
VKFAPEDLRAIDGRGASLSLRRVVEKPGYQRDELAPLRCSQRRQ